MNVKLNDTVLVITGKYAGKQGKVIATSPKSGKAVSYTHLTLPTT